MSTEIASFVFLDLETTSLPSQEHNKTKIIELSMVTVCREHLLDTRPGCVPRVLDKLTLCLTPGRRISDESTSATGLDNELLEHKTPFNKEVCSVVKTFLNLQPKPVCLIAHNGMGFDFPILKKHFDNNQESLPGVLCSDCYHGFYDILETKNAEEVEIMNRRIEDGSPKSEHTDSNGERGERVRKDLSKIFADLPTCGNTQIDNKNHVLEAPDQVTLKPEPEVSSPSTVVLEIPQETSARDNLNELGVHVNRMMQLQNESTPKRQVQRPRRSTKEIRERRFPWPNTNKPNKSYKLGPLYERVLNRQAQDAHQAENDCLFALQISIAVGLLVLTGALWGCTNPFIRQGTRGLRGVKAKTRLGQVYAEIAFLMGNWRYVLPWLANQSGSLAYLAAVQRAPLSVAVPAANGLAFAFTAVVGAAVGAEEPLDRWSSLGVMLIVAGTALCCLDKTS